MKVYKKYRKLTKRLDQNLTDYKFSDLETQNQNQTGNSTNRHANQSYSYHLEMSNMCIWNTNTSGKFTFEFHHFQNAHSSLSTGHIYLPQINNRNSRYLRFACMANWTISLPQTRSLFEYGYNENQCFSAKQALKCQISSTGDCA